MIALWMAGHFYYASISRPRPVSGPIRWGYDFTVVAMDGNHAVKLTHEWGRTLPRRLGGLKGSVLASARAEIDAETVRVIERRDRDDFVNVYRVENDRVTPLAWSFCRPETVALVLIPLALPILIACAAIWRLLLRKKLMPSD